jgi:hypothetical protein
MASAEPAIPVRPANKASLELVAAKSLAAVPSIFSSDRLSSKNVWVAALLALFFGPAGMVYSTPVGALIMSVVSIPVFVFGGWLLSLAVWPVCIFWAVMAARD